jgi:DNA invertase Pin-like site-specific DNA recombinase
MTCCYIYARVSSIGDRQSTERQVKSLSELATSNGYEIRGIFEEHKSGATSNKERKVLVECLENAIANKIDIILFSELSRCGRNTWEVLECIKFCIDHHINVYFQKEGLTLFREDGNVDSIMAIYTSCIGFCAEQERSNIIFRLRQGRELAIQKGVKMGRKVGSVKTREQKAVEYATVIRCIRKGCSVRDTAKLCDVGISTVQRVKKEFGL